MSDKPRVRFAPAPSGNLHVGSAHTALFNWLFARRHEGTFILRIEDTDTDRSTDESVVAIQESLRWLGLEWDEGPYRQSKRSALYAEAADELVAAGRAYECYCTEAELKARADAAVASGRAPGYDGRCRELSAAQRSQLASEGRPRSIRFRTPDEGISAFDDVIRGRVSVEWSTIADFVIVRSSGAPVFFLANAVDDAAMGITHVIRGEDLLDSTHRILALRHALGNGDPPSYAHVGMLVGGDRAKLSKRHGAVGLGDFRERGYLAEAVFNYLALLQFSPGEEREVLDREELVAAFDLERVTHAAAFFDHQKLDWMNGEHIRRLPVEEFALRARPFTVARYGSRFDDAPFAAAMALAHERVVTLGDAAAAVEFLFVDEQEFEVAPESWERVRAADRVDELFAAVIAAVEGCAWTVEGIDATLRTALEGLGMKPRKALPAVYSAIEGRHTGLPLFDSIHLLGRPRALRRLRAAQERLAEG